jgi:hypothetical protein
MIIHSCILFLIIVFGPSFSFGAAVSANASPALQDK